ncbi:hypothetical protein CAPTEDRAFT_181428 [Capitella teleta]|uniref:Sodium/nucleoside cotransporter n=1 Tax=Capitella teleta TaxID=283909 RepID=R7UB89_CAPTE|nr:hypothetical protein CAPTEDRAFT_181428 [Capitella teleta]|eukprot:ELU00517.1 hypothetical protein CAPTEDRAFT_181428 [Capitella teleta]
MDSFWEKHGTKVKRFIYLVLTLAYFAYVIYAMTVEKLENESSIRLLWMSLLGLFIFFVYVIKGRYGDKIYNVICVPIVNFATRHFKVLKILFMVAVAAGIVVFLIVEVALETPDNLLSLLGMVIYVFLLFIFSDNPAKVRWRPVIWGLAMQFAFALLVLKTSWGYEAFHWLGDRVQEFMEYADEGAIFVFGDDFADHMFAFKVMPVVIFFSSTISILYYLGVMQVVILKIAWVMQRTMGTTAAESVNAAGNIFIGQTEAPLLIRPLINDMTASELHAVMVGGFGTIAGSVLATYIVFGIPANHLISASIMAAPCALAMSKLFYPETEDSKTKEDDVDKMEPSPQQNVIEAASAGASDAIPLVANICANIIAFLSLLAFVNTTLTWMGHRVGLRGPDYPELTFQMICSYVLWPFAFIMGVATDDCRQVAKLIGVKTFINEFVAYTDLNVIIDNTDIWKDYTGEWETNVEGDIYLNDLNVTLVGGVMEDRSIVISTYALCGFANVGSIGTVMGALGAMAPHRKDTIAALALRAMIAGNVVSFMNACTAGLLYEPSTATNSTMDATAFY